MSGCRSCTSCSSEPNYRSIKQVEKLEKVECSGNPRYPHIFVGKQAMYTDENAELIVTVLEDTCDDTCDCFTLKPQRILKDSLSKHTNEEAFDVAQPADDDCWKLRALI
jgi:hypothetical protein